MYERGIQPQRKANMLAWPCIWLVHPNHGPSMAGCGGLKFSTEALVDGGTIFPTMK